MVVNKPTLIGPRRLRDARGEVVCVLDAASYFESRQHHTQTQVQMPATHAGLDEALLARRFRADLLYRLNPVCAESRRCASGVTLPPPARCWPASTWVPVSLTPPSRACWPMPGPAASASCARC